MTVPAGPHRAQASYVPAEPRVPGTDVGTAAPTLNLEVTKHRDKLTGTKCPRDGREIGAATCSHIRKENAPQCVTLTSPGGRRAREGTPSHQNPERDTQQRLRVGDPEVKPGDSASQSPCCYRRGGL